MSGWREIGVLIADMVAKEPPYIQIAVGLCAAFVALMILEGLRASFIPRRNEGQNARARSTTSRIFRSAPANAAKPPRNRKQPETVVKPYRAPRPVINRHKVKAVEASSVLPQVASFGD